MDPMQAEKHSLTSNISAHIFCFLRRLCHGWLLCKHSTDRGQTKSFQSIPWNPVAPACFRGERCSLTCQSVCTQTATVSKGAEFSILSQAFSAREETRYTGEVLKSPRLIQSRKDTQTQLRVCVNE